MGRDEASSEIQTMRTQTASTRTKSGGRPRRRKTLADQADRHSLYERSVQDPETDADTLADLYRRIRGTEPKVLREDFCGTATLCGHWVAAKKGRKAIGVDFDLPTLEWGQEHNIKSRGKSVDERVRLLHGDVLDGIGPKADIVCALNFSYFCFKRRSDLLRYFQAARSKLKKDGLFIMDIFGGTEAMDADETEHDLGDFKYRWEQEWFDPLTHEMVCHIHFHFPDGSALSPAFSYEWRMWTVPEIADLLEEAGFSKVRRMWDDEDDDGDADESEFYEPERVENQESWWTYIVAEP